MTRKKLEAIVDKAMRKDDNKKFHSSYLTKLLMIRPLASKTENTNQSKRGDSCGPL